MGLGCSFFRHLTSGSPTCYYVGKLDSVDWKANIMNRREIEDKIIELVAREEGSAPADLRAELLSRGKELPIDSEALTAVSIELAEFYNVDFEYDETTAEAMRTVTSFAGLILDLLKQQRAKSK